MHSKKGGEKNQSSGIRWRPQRHDLVVLQSRFKSTAKMISWIIQPFKVNQAFPTMHYLFCYARQFLQQYIPKNTGRCE